MTKGTESFREWLIERLLATRHVRAASVSGSLEATARAIGVQPDVLAEARLEYRMRCAREGRQPPLGDKRAETRFRHIQIRCEMPPEIYKLWTEHCAERSVQGSALLRSLIHEYLLGSREPEVIVRRWVWQGRELRTSHATVREERALVTRGAFRALELRSQKVGHQRAALIRGLVQDTLQGKHPFVRLVDARTMYDDEERYLADR